MDSLKNKLQRVLQNKKAIFGFLGVVVLILVLVLIFRSCGKNEDEPETPEVSVDAEASLERVLEISELSTVSFTYNAIVKVPGKDDEYKYYVAYEGNVIAEIDFNKIEVSIREESKTVTAVLPEVTIQEVNVDIGSLEFIFVDEDAETETVLQEAYKLCAEDLKIRADKEEEIKEMAHSNAVSAVSALVNSWVAASGNDYTVEVR